MSEYIVGGQPEEIVVPPTADGSPTVSESTEGAPTMTDMMVTPEAIEEIMAPSDAGVPVVPAGLRDVDPAKLAEIREKLGRFMTKRGTTVSGAEDPDSASKVDQEGRTLGEVMKGEDVDWSEYDLQYDVRHLYKRAMFRETAQGPKWVAMLDEFYSTEKDARSHGKMVNVPGGTEGVDREPQNLGEYLSQMTNGSEGWAIAAILPGTMGKALVVMRKQTAVALPDPKPLKKAEEVEAPKEQELQNIEDAALAFAENEGLTAPPVVEDTEVKEDVPAVEGADFSNRFFSRNEVDESLVEEGTGAIVARDSALIQRAIATAAPMTVEAPAPAGIQPKPVEYEGGQLAAGVVNVALGMRNILDGPDFGEVK